MVLLVRDSILNLHSFLNQNKSFYLDNTRSDTPRNVLRLEPETLSKGELSLWAWDELYLRYLQMTVEKQVDAVAIIHTPLLQDPEYMPAVLDKLSLTHRQLATSARRNTNASLGFKGPEVRGEDVPLFNDFLKMPPEDARRANSYFDDYVPRQSA